MRQSLNKVILAFVCFLMCACGKDDFVTDPFTEEVVVDEKIIGTAFYDTDGDGIGDIPMKGAEVLYGDSSFVFNPDMQHDSSVLKTYVEGDGSYLFEGVPPAQEKVILLQVDLGDPLASHPFVVIGTDNLPDGDDGETEEKHFISIDIEDGEVDDGNDFLATYLPLSVSGSVLQDSDADGVGDSPMSNYFVRLSGRLPDGQPSPEEFWVGVTDDEGVYRIAGISPGEYVLQIAGNTNWEVVSGTDMTPDPDGTGDPLFPHLIPVDLVQDEHDADNIFVIESRKGVISGTVRGPSGNGMVHRWVGLYAKLNGVPATTLTENLHTDEQGNYSFTDIPSGDYYVKLLSIDDQLVDLGDTTPDPDGAVDPAFPDMIPVSLGNQEIDIDNDFVITIKTGRISGRVMDDVDGDGIGDVPVANDVVLIHYRGLEGAPISNPAWPWNEEVAYTDANGYYSFGWSVPEAGNFVIQHIGSGAHLFTCISSEDNTPEMGEPQNQHPECMFIQCDLNSAASEDHNNDYVIQID